MTTQCKWCFSPTRQYFTDTEKMWTQIKWERGMWALSCDIEEISARYLGQFFMDFARGHNPVLYKYLEMLGRL